MAVPEQQKLSSVTIAVCHLWILKYSAIGPPEHTITGLSDAFGDPPRTLRHWFCENVTTSGKAEDPTCQSPRRADLTIASRYRLNRKDYNRKAGDLPISGRGSLHLERDEARPYLCTSRCGKTFPKKDS